MAVVSISRQVGSHGEKIAVLLAEKLGYTLIKGSEIYQKAKTCSEDFKKECALYEHETTEGFWERFFLNKPANASLLAAINYELASENNVILIGRGSQIVFNQVPWILKVRIVAPKEIRIQRLCEGKGMLIFSHEQAEKYIDSHDTARKALVEQLYGIDERNWSQLYDLVINTANFNPEDCVALLSLALNNMGKMLDEAAWKNNLASMAKAKFIEYAIRKKIKAGQFSFINVTYSPSGSITISGSVPDYESKYKAGQIALNHDGVDGIDNQLIISG